MLSFLFLFLLIGFSVINGAVVGRGRNGHGDCNGNRCGEQVDVNDPEIKLIASIAIRKLNSNFTEPHYQQLVEIQSATTKFVSGRVSGRVYNLKVLVETMTCLKSQLDSLREILTPFIPCKEFKPRQLKVYYAKVLQQGNKYKEVTITPA